MKSKLSFFLTLTTLTISPLFADDAQTELPLVFSEDFEKGFERWEPTDQQGWTHREIEKNHVFGINARKNNYKPKVRSPYHIALIKDIKLSDFIITFRVRSTKDTGNHRDCCVFFNHQDPTHFYYVHLGARPDPHSGQIMIVNGSPRKAITENKNNVPWDNQWHQVKIQRDSQKGTIEIFFDDMKKPIMTATDKTFSKGRIGIGSFDDMNDFDDVKLWGR
ncbi:MAG: hypothetical protein ABF382_02645 [Akkermansiaceae bacterium]